MAKNYVFWKRCDQLDDAPELDEVASLDAMTEAAEEITYAQFVRNCEGVDEWAKAHNYDSPHTPSSHGLKLKDDWHVSFHRSNWDGEPCYYMVWSAYEVIWRKKSAQPTEE